jgi:hypothetical protein
MSNFNLIALTFSKGRAYEMMKKTPFLRWRGGVFIFETKTVE